MKKQTKKKTPGNQKPDVTQIVLWIVIGALILGGVVFGIVMAARAIWNARLDRGDPYRNDVVLRTDRFSVNAAMLSYRFYDAFYSGALQTGYDDPEQLKNVASIYEGVSLFEFDRDLVLSSLDDTLRYAEAAARAGKTLDGKDLTVLQNRLKGVENAAKNAGEELDDYLSARYGRGVKRSDIEDLLRLELLAEKQWNDMEAEARAAVSEAEIDEALAKSDPTAYLRIDYYIVDLDPSDTTIETPEIAISRAAARENAARLASAATAEEFRALAQRYMRALYEDDSSVNEENFVETFDADCYFEGRTFRQTSAGDPDSTVWLFDTARKTGDVYLDEEEATVYYIARGTYSVDAPVDAFRVISFSYDDYPSRGETLDAFNAALSDYEKTARTEEDFKAMVAVYERNSARLAREGYYDNTLADSAFNRLLDEQRAKLEENGVGYEQGKTYELYGDTAVYLLYYAGKGDPRSRVEARETQIDRKCDAAYSALSKEIDVAYTEAEGDRIAPRYAAA